MTHKCKSCGKSAPEVKFAKQDQSANPRSKCNGCRNARKPAAKPAPRDYGSAWANLCADERPDWGWNHRHVPCNHDKGQEFQI